MSSSNRHFIQKSYLNEQINELISYFDKNEINYEAINSNKHIDLSKGAYPNTESYMYIPGQHNTQKWLTTVKKIFSYEKDEGRVSAVRKATAGWNLMEVYDFLNWLKFYEAGNHMKYKMAQLWFDSAPVPNKSVYEGAPGYFLHVKQDPVKKEDPSVSGKDIDFARDAAEEEMSRSERKQIIEKQRNKIIGRLDSAEKLLRSNDGQIFAGKELESLMESIYQLKKKIQMVNKISSSTRLYEDMIVREANILHRGGFIKAANILYSVAQTPAQSGQDAAGSPAGSQAVSTTPPPPPTESQGAPGGLPSMGPGMPQNPPESAPESKGMSEFLENMDTAKLTTKEDKHGVEDDLEVKDTLDVSDANDDLFVSEAQTAPLDIPLTDTPAPAKLNPSPVDAPTPNVEHKNSKPKPAEDLDIPEPLEVSEDDIKPKDPNATPASVSNFDSKIDAVLSNITVADVVAKLEDLAKIFKTREVPRQLGIVDMMLDSLGLASYFPSLSEATNKSLESNNYISTRVEDILSKLRGAMASHESIDLKGKEDNDNPQVNGIKGKLQEDTEKEKARKQMRKDQENAELAGKEKETPEVEIEEDLTPPKIPAAPAPKTPLTI